MPNPVFKLTNNGKLYKVSINTICRRGQYIIPINHLPIAKYTFSYTKQLAMDNKLTLLRAF